MSPNSHGSFLLDEFREFYREVVRLKRRVSRDSWVYEESDPERDAEPGERSPTAVWQRLLGVLERQALTARRRGGEFGADFYRDAQYLMAALADEIFLHLDWRGSESWSSNLLETKLFGSHRAGEAVFQRLDDLLAGRNPVDLDLAKVYLLVLALGFQGKFRGQPDGMRQLTTYRQEILELIFEREPQFREGVRELFPEAYASTLDQGRSDLLPHFRNWKWAALGAVGLWLVISGWVWWVLTDDLRTAIETILP